jgi:uncharacterized membrane protein
MNDSPQAIAREIFRSEWAHLNTHEREVIEAVLHRISIPRNANKEFVGRRTFGEKTADGISAFGGSWTFILIFLAWLAFWVVLNTEILGPRNEAFDPYPFIFLNLVLSMLAAIQAPIILMSQKRGAERDRLEADIDHEVNVRAELAIRQMDERLHEIEKLLAKAPREPSGT